jgi:carbamoyl-phosphate synthase large subunit
MAADGSFEVPHACSQEFPEALLKLCSDNDIRMVVPTIDTELKVLSENRKLFSDNEISIIISDPDVVGMCRDKRQTHAFFDSIGLQRSREVDVYDAALPIFAKPFDGSSSIGAAVIRDRKDLTEDLLNDRKMMFLEYLDPSEYIEYTVDMYFSESGDLKCAVPRERLEVRGGEISKGVTRRGVVYDTVCDKFSKCKGMRGCITLQLFRHRHTGEIKAIEINPRFGGGYPLSYHANANYPGMLISEYLLGKTPGYYEEWKADLLMLRYDDEIIIDGYKGR